MFASELSTIRTSRRKMTIKYCEGCAKQDECDFYHKDGTCIEQPLVNPEKAEEEKTTGCEDCRYAKLDFDEWPCRGCVENDKFISWNSVLPPGASFEEDPPVLTEDDTYVSAYVEPPPAGEPVGVPTPAAHQYGDITIKDSGERFEFSTGAVRDAQVGKGRFDLLPLMAVWKLAKHYEVGCLKYGDRNWEKGIPLSRYYDSAMRHLLKHMAGLRDENHLMAAAWNLMCAIETLHRIEGGILPADLDDMPYTYKEVEKI
jgi:hypothetical protein